MIALDACLLIAHFHPLDEHHDVATRFFMERADQTFLVHSLTLAEVLVGGARIGSGRDVMLSVMDLGILVAPRDDDEPLRIAELRAATGLRLPDCCVLDVALFQGAHLATFDAALATAARGRRVSVVP